MFDLIDAIFRLMAGEYNYGMIFTFAIFFIFIIAVFIRIRKRGFSHEIGNLSSWFLLRILISLAGGLFFLWFFKFIF